jgi:hypothetical protein
MSNTRKPPAARAHPLEDLCLEVWKRKATRLTANASRARIASDDATIRSAFVIDANR